MTGSVGSVRRISASVSKPSISGISRSSSTTSGWSRRDLLERDAAVGRHARRARSTARRRAPGPRAGGRRPSRRPPGRGHGRHRARGGRVAITARVRGAGASRRSISRVKGFMTYSSAPASRARHHLRAPRSRWSPSPPGRSTSTAAARTAATNSMPVISGMFQSTRTSSGARPASRRARRLAAVGRPRRRRSRAPSACGARISRMARESSITRAARRSASQLATASIRSGSSTRRRSPSSW